MQGGVVASSTVLKYLQKVKLTNTFQHIQVYKFQENQMSKSSTKLWKAYIHFPYDLMKLHTFEKLLSFSINLFERQLNPPQKLTSQIRFPWFPIKLCMHDLPSAKAGVQSDARMPGVHTPHCAQIFPKEEWKHTGVPGCYQGLSPTPLSSIRLPPQTQPRSELLQQTQSLNSEMTQRSRKSPCAL